MLLEPFVQLSIAFGICPKHPLSLSGFGTRGQETIKKADNSRRATAMIVLVLAALAIFSSLIYKHEKRLSYPLQCGLALLRKARVHSVAQCVAMEVKAHEREENKHAG